jgi:hypothetical protein
MTWPTSARGAEKGATDEDEAGILHGQLFTELAQRNGETLACSHRDQRHRLKRDARDCVLRIA